jgi:hypothetical protein
MAGYIDIPDLEDHPEGIKAFDGPREFIVLSRASIQGHERDDDPNSGPSTWKRNNILEGIGGTRNFIDEKGYFDIHTYHTDIHWCLYNVMMIEREERFGVIENIAYRLAVGRVHVEAVVQAGAVMKVINLE